MSTTRGGTKYLSSNEQVTQVFPVIVRRYLTTMALVRRAVDTILDRKYDGWIRQLYTICAVSNVNCA